MLEIDKDIILCPYCGQISRIVWVHGHGQCLVCKTTIDECCRGEVGGNIENVSEKPENNNNNNKHDENK